VKRQTPEENKSTVAYYKMNRAPLPLKQPRYETTSKASINTYQSNGA